MTSEELSLWERYNRCLEVAPLKTNLVTSGVIDGLSDVFSQKVLQGKKEIDWSQTLKTITFSVFLKTPLLHWWHKKLFQLISDPSFKGTLLRVLLDQTLFSLLLNSLFIIYYKLWEGERDSSVILQQVKESAPSYVKAGWVVWPFVVLVNFRYIPPQYRSLFGNLAGFCWGCYLALKSNKAK